MTEADQADTVAVVKRVLDAFNRRDADTILALVAADAKFESMTGQLLHGGRPYVGREGLLDYFADADRLWPGMRIEITQIQAAGDGVVAIGHVQIQTDSGEIQLPVIWTWKLRAGLVVECIVHGDEGAARRALGGDS